MKIAKVDSTAKNSWGVLMPISASNLTKLQGFAAAVYIDFLTAGDRNQLLSGQRSIDDIIGHYNTTQQAELEAAKRSFTVKWADATDRSTAKYYMGNMVVDSTGHDRITAWVTSNNNNITCWIRCIWQGANGDEFTYLDCKGGFEGFLPAPGTILSVAVDELFNACGFVSWFDGEPPE